ncbi:hypothetical protein [Paenibacillus sp. FSL P2-0173]|uniref:hypothetical protein n=1 Tax=Paenibacillus sp. FSL P2-0173 TaxID=2921627 RepID=UPI0030F70947
MENTVSAKFLNESEVAPIGQIYFRKGTAGLVNNLPDKTSVPVQLSADISLKEYIVNYSMELPGTKVFVTKVELNNANDWVVTVYNDSGATVSGKLVPLIMGGIH